MGQFLERLRERGTQVIHDFPGEKFNVDRVVVHQSGVYAIATKTYSKPDWAYFHRSRAPGPSPGASKSLNPGLD